MLDGFPAILTALHLVFQSPRQPPKRFRVSVHKTSYKVLVNMKKGQLYFKAKLYKIPLEPLLHTRNLFKIWKFHHFTENNYTYFST